MTIKSNLTGAAVALTVGAGAATAAGPFAALSGVPAEAMSAEEMAAVEGKLSFCCTLFSSAGSGGSLLLRFDFGIVAVKPALGVHWDDRAAVEAAIGGPVMLFVPQAGLGLTPPSRRPQ